MDQYANTKYGELELTNKSLSYSVKTEVKTQLRTLYKSRKIEQCHTCYTNGQRKLTRKIEGEEKTNKEVGRFCGGRSKKARRRRLENICPKSPAIENCSSQLKSAWVVRATVSTLITRLNHLVYNAIFYIISCTNFAQSKIL